MDDARTPIARTAERSLATHCGALDHAAANVSVQPVAIEPTVNVPLWSVPVTVLGLVPHAESVGAVPRDSKWPTAVSVKRFVLLEKNFTGAFATLPICNPPLASVSENTAHESANPKPKAALRQRMYIVAESECASTCDEPLDPVFGFSKRYFTAPFVDFDACMNVDGEIPMPKFPRLGMNCGG